MFSIFVLALFLQVCVLHYSVVGAIIDYAAKKFLGIEHTYKVVKTSLMSAEDYVAKNKDEAVRAYLRIFRSLAEAFMERKFVQFVAYHKMHNLHINLNG
jgi:hypothetical protein